MRRLAVAALAVLVGVGALVGYGLYRKHLSRDHYGRSATRGFQPRALPKPVLAKGIAWPTFAFDNARLHVGPGNVRPPFRRVWTAGGASLLEFPPAVAFRRLYLSDANGTLMALSARTGARAWVVHENRCVAASPAVNTEGRGTVFEAFLDRRPCRKNAADGEVVAVATGTGKVRWRKHIGASETSPLLIDQHLYVGDWQGTVWCIREGSGKTVWTYRTGGPVKAAIASAGDRVYAASYDGHVYALNADTGKLAWRASEDPRFLGGVGTFYSTPALAYGRLFLGSTDGKVYAFDLASGARRWSHSTGGYVYGSPAIWNREVLVGSYDHVFYAFDAATGDLDWRFHANGPISGSATVVDGIVYFATLSGRTYGLDARTGKQLWTFPDGKYTPVVTDGRRLYLNGYGKVYALAPVKR
ncbi:MAG: PQQ-binding-like beta-propeller repeat protein [Actinobacteria bacterium]|nr:PQQ-binding-like beta-propeller repeat protein [Actinomycetota bacterium]